MIESSVPIDAVDVSGHYDDLDVFYRQLWGDHLHHGYWHKGDETPLQATENLIHRIALPLELQPGARVCDVGCGYGATSRYLAEKYGFQMTGLTISSTQYEYAIAQPRATNSPTYLLRNWESNQLADGSFDGLVSIECIAHVPHKDVYFEEVARVLKPGGRACITAWLTAERSSPTAQRWLLEPICREGRLPSMGAASEYTQLAEAAGLRQVKYEDVTRQVRKTWAICVWRVVKFCFFSRAGWRFIFSSKSRHAIFLLSVARIWIAYATGAMKYGIFEFEKPTQ
ncbi:Demethylrebeccamycin-D-glucose O-methyltransferase [Rosistilla carotiformis]|uniref:Demethylrebeccamycin-D-glucose O-methyltransferase n=1 Tax=Rosistilla carotiformis TaxID=2528017 RepID=A0A518JX02_9BACT|nr:class I SAM-dependent methyltransferase [Rosistilla carotiformis]QDV70046.1 Demethylrebeccamycin-D-glucose O-methyltransferase [Rosistilla carotiformis]